MSYVWERGEVWWGDQRERPLGRSTLREDCILKLMIMKWNGEAGSGLIWPRTQTDSG
jgi:hypothetical protein